MAALALVLAQLIGAYAHAGHDHFGGHAGCAHEHGGTDAVAPGGDPAGDGQQPGDGRAEHGDRATHSQSCDFLCHGGVAILASSAFAYVDPTPRYPAAVAAFGHLLLPASLERPPRSPVRA